MTRIRDFNHRVCMFSVGYSLHITISKKLRRSKESRKPDYLSKKLKEPLTRFFVVAGGFNISMDVALFPDAEAETVVVLTGVCISDCLGPDEFFKLLVLFTLSS